jgi:hypothetical protein
MRSLRQFPVMIVCMFLIAGAFTAYGEKTSWMYDGVEYRIPKPADDLLLPGDIPESHTVVVGDTLWAISNRYLNDPFLWPLVWEENIDTISNPHRIYPGDTIRLPSGVMIATDTDIPEPAPVVTEPDDAETVLTEIDTTGRIVRETKPYPVITQADLIASGMISRDKIDGPPIIAAETTAFDLAYDDVVFVQGGPDEGINHGETYFIMRERHHVEHPISGRSLGRMYHIVGEAEVLCLSDTITSARISKSYSAVLRGDFLVPRVDIPMPLTTGSAPVDRCNPSTGTLPGTIVDSFVGGQDFADAVIMAQGDIAYIDLGSDDGVAPGDFFAVFTRDADDPRIPRYVSGELMVVKVLDTTSVVVVTQSNTAVFLGDTIELK